MTHAPAPGSGRGREDGAGGRATGGVRRLMLPPGQLNVAVADAGAEHLQGAVHAVDEALEAMTMGSPNSESSHDASPASSVGWHKDPRCLRARRGASSPAPHRPRAADPRLSTARTPAARMAANIGALARADDLGRRGPADHSPSRMRSQRWRSARQRTGGRPGWPVGSAVPATSSARTSAAIARLTAACERSVVEISSSCVSPSGLCSSAFSARQAPGPASCRSLRRSNSIRVNA